MACTMPGEEGSDIYAKLPVSVTRCLMTLLYSDQINPLKTKPIHFISGLSAYRAVNTLHFGYKNQSLNAL
jgi:hypothetical protein